MQYMDQNRSLTRSEKQEKAKQRDERDARIAEKNKRLGLLIFQISWIMIFVCLIVAYWQLGFSPNWRPTPEQAPSPWLPTLATGLLIASAWTGHRAWHNVEDTSPQNAASSQWLTYWQATLGLGAGFLVIMATQYIAVPASEEQLFGYIYRLMIGYHALHAVVIGAMMGYVWRWGRRGRYHAENVWAVEGTTKLWDFVVVAWLLFYVVLYVPFIF